MAKLVLYIEAMAESEGDGPTREQIRKTVKAMKEDYTAYLVDDMVDLNVTKVKIKTLSITPWTL